MCLVQPSPRAGQESRGSVDNTVIQAETKPFFRDELVNLIDFTFQKAKHFKLIQQYVDGESFSGPTFTISSRTYHNFSTCSYLGLEVDQRVKAGIVDFANRYGASFIMSRSYASSAGFAEFEDLLSRIFDAYPVVTPSTTLGHLSFMSVMIQKGDLVMLDQQVHNSVQMAAATVADKARVVFVRNNGVVKLRKYLDQYSQQPDINNIWYCGDGIYSMSGQKARVRELISLLDFYPKFHCYLDDAHGISIFGKHGRGYVLSQMESLHERMVVAASLSKSFGMGCGGALLFPNREWQRKVQTCGPTMIFSSPIPPPMLGGGIAAAKIHLTDELDDMQRQVHGLIRHFQSAAKDAGLEMLSDDLSPIQFIRIGEVDPTLLVGSHVLEDGFFVNVCGYPAVPKRKCGLRITITRHVDQSLIERLVSSIAKALKKTMAVP